MTLILAANRRKAVEHLRTTTIPQARFALCDNGYYCALGHIGLAVGIDVESVADDLYARIDAAVGMDSGTSDTVLEMNDYEGLGLCEIGDYLAGKWGIA